MTFKSIINKRIGNYPCNDYLNNALRALLRDKSSTDDISLAIQEIVCCIQAAGGYFSKDVEQSLKEHSYLKY